MPDLIFLTARIRRALHRPLVRRSIVGLVGLGTAAAVALALQATNDARARWGETRPVAVASRALAPGDPLDPTAAEVRRLPATAVAEDALADPPTGATVRHPIAAGEPLVAERLAPTGVSGTAALIPDGHRAVGVPAGQLAAPPLTAGDLVDVVILSSPGAGVTTDHDQGQSRDQELGVVAGARVLDVTDEVVTLGVPATDAPVLAHAAASGVVALTLTNR